MLIQKRGINKRTQYLLIVMMVIILGGGYFAYSQFYAAPSSNSKNTNSASLALVTPTSVSNFEDEIFSDPQLYQFKRGVFPGYTNQHTGVVLDDRTPLAPVNVTIANPATGGALTLSWETPEQLNYTEARVYRSTSQGTKGELIATLPATAAGQLMTYLDTEVTNNARYYYVVRLATGDSESTNATQVVAIPTDTLAPDAPQNVTVTSADDVLVVSWSFDSTDDVAAVRVYRSTVRGVLGVLLSEVTLEDVSDDSGNTYSLVDNTVQSNITYYYTVTAVDVSGNESSKDLLTVPVHTNPFEPIEF